MEEKYNPQTIESRWQKYWEREKIFNVDDDYTKENITFWKCFPTHREKFTWDTFVIIQ
jgi:Leucyl-tRNA synthetase